MMREEEVTWAGEPFVVKFDYTPGHPGRTTGPPDRCYPPEGPEYDITYVAIFDPRSGQRWDLTDWIRTVGEDLLEQLSDLLFRIDEERDLVEDEDEEEEEDDQD